MFFGGGGSGFFSPCTLGFRVREVWPSCEKKKNFHLALASRCRLNTCVGVCSRVNGILLVVSASCSA